MAGVERYVIARTDVEGLHHWAAAPPGEGYLRHPHRHLFVVTARLRVEHADREIEINDLTRWLRQQVLPGMAVSAPLRQALDFGPQSCEQLAERVVAAIRERHGDGRWIECEVLEDGILGGGVRWPA